MLKPKVPSLSAPDLWKLIGSALKGTLYPFEGKTGIWTFWISQPEGLPEGSRRSPRVFGGGDLRATAQEEAQHPGWGARPASEPDRADERAALAPLLGAPLSDAAFRWSLPPCPERPPSANPAGWPPLLSSVEYLICARPERRFPNRLMAPALVIRVLSGASPC